MMMERHQVIELMTELKLAGMRHAYDEVIADALKRQHPSSTSAAPYPMFAERKWPVAFAQ